MLNHRRFTGAALCALAINLGTPAHAETATDADTRESRALTDTIIVTGRPVAPLEQDIEPVTGHASAPDATSLVAQLPGAAAVNNGALSGQVQYRGLFSDRLAIEVGGQSFQTGGPNAMDPPLHYAPAILLDSISVSRGASQVRHGPGLGAMVDAQLKQVTFGTGATLSPAVDVSASYRSTDDGLAFGGVAGMASDSLRFNLIASYEEGDDYRIGKGGRAADTAYERLTFGASAGAKLGDGVLSLDLRRQETGKSGNPPFAMDIIYFDTNFARLGFEGDVAGKPVDFSLSYTGVRHGMDNFSLRPAPAMPAQYRYTYARADTWHARGSIGFGALSLGADAQWVRRNVEIRNPTNAAFTIGSLDHIRQHRIGGFAEIEGSRNGWHADLGLRVDHHSASMNDPSTGLGVPMMVADLATATAANNGKRSNTTLDAVARIWREDGTIRPRLTLSRKTRVPNAVERFGWLPTEASGGLADGNIYIGNQALKPETAWAAEAGVDVVSDRVTFRPSLFYRRIDNYIQGTPVPDTMMSQLMIAAKNGDPTPLMFSNVDAELYGIDSDVSWQISPGLRFEATVSYVRGKRRDVADNLYRIAPLNGRASLTYGQEGWSVTAEVVAAARQKKVSVANSEARSPGWASTNLWFDIKATGALRFSGGIENLFDRRYADHLAGINRIGGSDVAVGERMPATGRSAFIRAGMTF